MRLQRLRREDGGVIAHQPAEAGSRQTKKRKMPEPTQPTVALMAGAFADASGSAA
jgi:hypothetical protein